MTRLDRLTDRLNLKEFQLKALLDVTKAINNNLDREELLTLYGSIVHGELGITRLMLFERAEQWSCILHHGTHGEEQLIDMAHVAHRFTDIQLVGPEQHGSLGGFDIVVPVTHNERPLAFLFIGDIDDQEGKMSPSVKHLNFIQTLTNLIAVALENKRLARQTLQQERDRRELELAAEMQAMLVPRELPDGDRFKAAAWYLPHRQVGGDHYDVITDADGRVTLVIADVSGKGIAAALLMSNFQATLRALVHYTDVPLDQLVRELNDKVWASARGERFITLFIGRLALADGRLHYVNAGHNPPLCHHHGAFEELMTGSIALGMLPELPFLQVGECTLRPGSTLLCYTDGLVEQEDPHGKELGLAPLRRTVADLHASGPAAVNEGVIATFEAHRAGQPYLDDIALLTCSYG